MKNNKIKHTLLLPAFIILTFVAVWTIPVLGLFINSFRHAGDSMQSGWWNAFFHPGRLTLENYVFILTSGGLGRSFLNSLIITVPSTLFTIAVAAITAYPIAYYRFPGRTSIYIMIISLQIVPIQITMIPVLKMLSFIHLNGTFPGVWLAHTAYGIPFAVYLFRNFFAEIPGSLIESSQMDGAGTGSIFIAVILPLSLPVVATLGIFQFLWVWNDLLISLVYLGGSPEVAPLTVKITSLFGSLESGWHIMSAAAFLSMALPLFIFLLFQRYFIRGILAGAVKG